MKDQTSSTRRPTLDRLLLTAILVVQVAILACLVWQPAKGGSPLFRRSDREGSTPDTSNDTTPDPLRKPVPNQALLRLHPGAEFESWASPRSLRAETVLREARAMQARMDAAFHETLRELARLDDAFGAATRSHRRLPLPSIDMCENQNGYVIVSSLPGIDPRHLTVVLTGRTLTLGALQQDRQGLGEQRHFERTFRFPRPVVNDSSAAAWVSNGVLRVYVPKADPPTAAEPKVLRLL